MNNVKKTILAIDDDEDFLRTVKDILEAEGYEVKTLSDPTKTEHYIDKYHPSLLIIDIFMPVRSGFNLIEDFRDKGLYEDVPKIFLTCLDDDIERMTARAWGVSYYMTKPFQPEELIRQVNNTLGVKR
ncbi:two-component system response regulator [Candidatus Omnitrophota bacterium]